MKKFFASLLVLSCFYVQAQYVDQLVFIRSFNTLQIDSYLTHQGLPSALFPIYYGFDVYKIVYNTVAGDSTPTTASGLMVVPVGAPCKVPIMSYQHGTTIKKSDVPSRLSGEWFIALIAASRGIVGIMPDYLGLGDGPGFHPYQHAQSEATATIDMIRATKEIADSVGAPVNNQLFLMGYSQGGHATMAAHKMIQEHLDNEIHVTASVPMSGAYDMSGTMSEIMLSDSTYPDPYYLPYLFFGFNSVYHLFTNTSDVMIHPYDSILPPLFDGTHNGGTINSVMPQIPKLIMQPFQIDSFRNDSLNFFKEALRKNDTYKWIPNSPMHILYCVNDHSVSYHNTEVAYTWMKNHGATLVDTANISNTLDHYDCAQFAILNAVNWLLTFQYQPLHATFTVTDVTDASVGSVTAIPDHGNAGYNYLWSTGDTTQTITQLGPGVYYVTITDQSLCTYTDSAIVRLEMGINDFALSNVRVYPNPSKGVINVEVKNTNETLKEVQLYNLNGQVLKTYRIDNGYTTQILFSDYSNGVYYLDIKAESGKQLRQKIVLLNE